MKNKMPQIGENIQYWRNILNEWQTSFDEEEMKRYLELYSQIIAESEHADLSGDLEGFRDYIIEHKLEQLVRARMDHIEAEEKNDSKAGEEYAPRVRVNLDLTEDEIREHAKRDFSRHTRGEIYNNFSNGRKKLQMADAIIYDASKIVLPEQTTAEMN